MGLVIVGFLLLGAVTIRYQARGHYLAQYLFFLRYPLLFGLVLAVGPVVSVTIASQLLGNLFALDASGILISTAIAFFTSSTVVYAFNLVFARTPDRTKLPFFKQPNEKNESPFERHAALADKLAAWHFHASAVLLLPLIVVLTLKSSEPWYLAAFFALSGAGLGFAISFRGSGKAVDLGLRSLDWVARQLRRVGGEAGRVHAIASYVKGLFGDGFGPSADAGDRLQARSLLFFIVSAVLYAVGFFVLRWSFGSEERLIADAIPPLAYVLLLMLFWTWLLAFFAYVFDKYRVPPGLVLAAMWGLSYWAWSKDHYFELVKSARAEASGTGVTAACSLSPTQTVDAWAARNTTPGKKPTLVIVAASGGGITASVWTARVLTALSAKDGGLGPDFARSIVLVSTASGGGVGASYFVDRYRDGRPPGEDRAELDAIVRASASSSLHDTAFALAYTDLLRVLVPALVDPDAPDRGRSLERSWGRFLSKPAVTLSDWRAGVEAGWRPTQVFNVTIAETGERMLLSPIDCPTLACGGPGPFWRGKSTLDLYGPGSDLPVVTAARLSATFPWVTPLSRAPEGLRGEHMGDGGYYDNFGIVTAIEWLFSVQAEESLADKVEKVLLVQVRASEHALARTEEDQGWLYAAAGPLLTLMNVRTTSQRNHNEAHLLGMKAMLTKQGVPVETVEFELAQETPLSWHLTAEEKQRILDYWDNDQKVGQARATLECLWKRPPAAWTKTCGTKEAIELSDHRAGAAIFKQVEEKAAQRVLDAIGAGTATAVAAAPPPQAPSAAPAAAVAAAPASATPLAKVAGAPARATASAPGATPRPAAGAAKATPAAPVDVAR
jgi:hypothetical protein